MDMYRYPTATDAAFHQDRLLAEAARHRLLKLARSARRRRTAGPEPQPAAAAVAHPAEGTRVTHHDLEGEDQLAQNRRHAMSR